MSPLTESVLSARLLASNTRRHLDELVLRRARDDLFRAHGELVETFRGDFITGEDVGTTPADMTYVREAPPVARLRTHIVAGAANNQLVTDEVALRMHERGIHYVRDFVANAGGVIAAATDLLGWSRQAVFDQIDAIRNSVADLVARAISEGTTPHAVALDYVRTELAQ